MISTRFYLDTRAVNEDTPAPLKLCISKKGKTAYLYLDVKIHPSNWDKDTQKVIVDKNDINHYLLRRKLTVDNLLRELIAKGEISGMTITQIKRHILNIISPQSDDGNLFINRFESFALSKKATRTKEIYLNTIKTLLKFDSNAKYLSFDQIKKEWVKDFVVWLTQNGMAKNTINIHLRNIRAVINDAIDNEVTSNYPMRNIDMTPEETIKRSMSVEDLRELFCFPLESWQQRYVDYFKLSFFLIGINPVDLLNCSKDNFKNGRLIYRRAKTKRLYNIKVEPEAVELLEKYKGVHQLVNFSENMNSYKTFVGKLNKGLKSIGIVTKVKNPKWEKKSRKHKYHINRISQFPNLSLYWCRHTWATIAYSLGIPDEIIAAALGHSHGNRTTAIYIDKSIANVDDANRKVINWVLYGR